MKIKVCWHWENLLRHKKSYRGQNTRCNKHWSIFFIILIFWPGSVILDVCLFLLHSVWTQRESYDGISFELLQSVEEIINMNTAGEKKGGKKARYSWILFLLAKNSNGLTILLFMATRTTLFEKSLISMIAVDMFSSTEQFRRKKLFY